MFVLVLLASRKLGGVTVFQSACLHPSKYTRWLRDDVAMTGWLLLDRPRRVLFRLKTFDIVATGISQRTGRRATFFDGVECVPDIRSEVLEIAEAKIELLINPCLKDFQFPAFLTSANTMQPVQMRGEISLTLQDLFSTADMQASVAFSRWVTRDWKRPTSFHSQLIAAAKTEQLVPGIRLPFELRLDNQFIYGVLLLEEYLGNDRFRATFSLSDTPKDSLAGHILNRTSKWLEDRNEKEVITEIGTILTVY